MINICYQSRLNIPPNFVRAYKTYNHNPQKVLQNFRFVFQVGSSASGKSSVVKTLANLTGKTLKTLPVTSAMDTADLLGGFEQVSLD